MAQPAAKERRYAPGDAAPVSGIYLVNHCDHRDDHYVVAIRGEEFPPCRKCKGQVTFLLVSSADYVSHDWDFAGPGLSAIAH